MHYALERAAGGRKPGIRGAFGCLFVIVSAHRGESHANALLNMQSFFNSNNYNKE